jgi:carbon storage regulator
MLILTRRIGESVFGGLSAEMKIKVLEINGDNVTIGFDWPNNIPILREEVWQRDQINLQRQKIKQGGQRHEKN